MRTKEPIDTRFFYYACRSVELPSRGYNRHFTLLREQEILLPPSVEEQRAIARVLHFLDQAVAVQAEIVDTAKTLRRRVMADVFSKGIRGEQTRESEIGDVPASWDVVEFRAVRDDLRYGTSTRCTLVPATYPVLRIPNILSARIDPTELKYCDMGVEEAERYTMTNGDLIFIRTNGVIERLGLCAVYRGTPEKALFASYLIRARLLPGVDPDFVAYFFGSDIGISLISSRATPAADGKYNLNTGIIDSLLVPIPSLDEQREISSVIRVCDQKIELHRQKLAAMQELFRRLLRGLMTGEVDIDQLAIPADTCGSAA
jgi:type I restriction enzyme S subunit